MKTILHITFDYPDLINKSKTKAIRDLVENTKEFSHLVFSFNRSIKFRTIIDKKDIISFRVFGLPKSIMLINFLSKCARLIIKTIEMSNFKFQIIHAHKLTFEGFIAYKISKKYNKQFIVTLRSTDTRLLAVRKDLVKMYAKILLKAAKIIIISPCMVNNLQNIFGYEVYHTIKEKLALIPNIVDRELDITYEKGTNGKFVTVSMLSKTYIKRKNICNILNAISYLKDKGQEVHLDIVGTGDGKRLLEKRIKKLNIQNNVTFIGYIDSKDMLNFLSHYTGFVLCSRYETFGFVYLEAILAGLPVICAKNSAIDGYFSEKFFTSVKFNDYINMAQSMLYIIEHEAELKLLLKDYVKSGGLKQFSCQEVIEKYQRLIKDISPEEEI